MSFMSISDFKVATKNRYYLDHSGCTIILCEPKLYHEIIKVPIKQENN